MSDRPGVDCPFCAISKQGLPAHGLYEDENSFVLLDRDSLGFGHCIVIPRSHVTTVYELDVHHYEALFNLAQRVAHRLREATRKKAVGFVAFGTGLPHAHLHLVPMDSDEVLLKPQPTEVSESTLAEHARRLRPYLADLREPGLRVTDDS